MFVKVSFLEAFHTHQILVINLEYYHETKVEHLLQGLECVENILNVRTLQVSIHRLSGCVNVLV